MNWRDVTDLQQLDILTAQRLGLRVEPGEDAWRITWHDEPSPIVSSRYPLETVLIKLWMGMFIPRYTSDLNATAGLSLFDGYELRVVVSDDGVTAEYRDLTVARKHGYPVYVYENVCVASTWLFAAPAEGKEALARTLAWHAMADERERAK